MRFWKGGIERGKERDREEQRRGDEERIKIGEELRGANTFPFTA